MINISGIHHNPKLYPQPHHFNPDNFAPDAIRRRHKCSFIPFSTGPRNCIGETKKIKKLFTEIHNQRKNIQLIYTNRILSFRMRYIILLIVRKGWSKFKCMTSIIVELAFGAFNKLFAHLILSVSPYMYVYSTMIC